MALRGGRSAGPAQRRCDCWSGSDWPGRLAKPRATSPTAISDAWRWLARWLAPRVLLLDEPTAGMNPRESAEFTEFVRGLRDQMSLAVLLIEHDMSVVMRVSDRVTVLDRGRTIAEGRPEEVRDDPCVVEAYLGRSGTAGLT